MRAHRFGRLLASWTWTARRCGDACGKRSGSRTSGRWLLATHAAYLRRRAADVGYSAQVLFQELRGRQYAGSYETVKRFVRPLREMQLYAAVTRTRFETPLGLQSQIDWGQARVWLTIGPHPMALRRDEMALRGVLRATDLPQAHDGWRVRVAGMVITRQRPGTAKGFVFLTLEDETGIANIIVRPDLFDRERMTVVRQPFLIVDGILQHQDGVLSVRAERVQGIEGSASVDAHDFH